MTADSIDEGKYLDSLSIENRKGFDTCNPDLISYLMMYLDDSRKMFSGPTGYTSDDNDALDKSGGATDDDNKVNN